MTEATVFPGPVEVLITFTQKLTQRNPDNATLLRHTVTSLQTCLPGYGIEAVVGTPIGILVVWNKQCDRFIRSLFDLTCPIPGLIQISLLIMLFSIGIGAKTTAVFISSMVVCIVDACTGIQRTRQGHAWLDDVSDVPNAQRLFRIAIPSVTPMIFTGLHTVLGGSRIALVAVELLAPSKGLDFTIQDVRLISRSDLIIVGMLCIGVVGLVLDIIPEAMGKMITKGMNVK